MSERRRSPRRKQALVEDDGDSETFPRTPPSKKRKAKPLMSKKESSNKKNQFNDSKTRQVAWSAEKTDKEDDEAASWAKQEDDSSLDDDEEDEKEASKKPSKRKSPMPKLPTSRRSPKDKQSVAKGPRAMDAAVRKKKLTKDKKNKKFSISMGIAKMYQKKANIRAADYSRKIRDLAEQGGIKGLSCNPEANAVSASESGVKELTGEALEEAAKSLKESHRVNFETVNFPGGSLNCDQERSKHHSAERVALYIRILRTWEDSKETLSVADRKLGYQVVKSYSLREEVDVEGTKSMALMKKEKKREGERWLRVVPNHQIFDFIHEAHLSVGHSKTALTFNAIKSRLIYTVSEKDVNNYIKTCPVCLDAPFRLPRQVGAKNPIISSFFRDRFQVDLIDFRNNIGIGANGVQYKWLMSLKDHFTRLMYLRALRTKNAEETSEELSHIFGLLGYPLVFHTDNGGEFRAEIVLEAIKQVHPDCWTVCGQPRNPKEQGSIERSHQPTKDVLEGMVAEYKKRNPKSTYTWLQFLGTAMGCINSSKSYGRHSQQPYSHVFVQDFRFPTSVPTSMLRKARNPEELARVLGDNEVTERLSRMGDLDGDDEDSDCDNMALLVDDVKQQFRELLDSGTVDQMLAKNTNSLNSEEGDGNVIEPDIVETEKKIPLDEIAVHVVRSGVFDDNGQAGGVDDFNGGVDDDGGNNLGMVQPDDDDDDGGGKLGVVQNDDSVRKDVVVDGCNNGADLPQTVVGVPKFAQLLGGNNNDDNAVAKQKDFKKVQQQSMLGAAMNLIVRSPPRIASAFQDYFSEFKPKKVPVKDEPLRPKVDSGIQLRKGFCEVNPSAAFQHFKVDVLLDKMEFGLLNVHLDCMFCRETGINTVPYLFFYEQEYYDMMMSTDRWFDSSLITAFISLKIHKHHVRHMLFDVCPYPRGRPHRIHQLPRNITTVIVVGWEGHHYGFIEINVPNRYVLVKDGFLDSSNHRKWTSHIMFMLHKWGLITDAAKQLLFRSNIVTEFERNKPTTPEGVYEVIPLRTVIQRNVTECGAIAAYHAWEAIHPLSKPTVVGSFRQEVILELLSMWKEFDSCLRVRLHMSKVPDTKQIIRQNVHGLSEGRMPDFDSDDEDDVCFLCNAGIDPLQDFDSFPCHHHYHIHCIHAHQRQCLITMDGIVGCVKCGCEITNLTSFSQESNAMEDMSSTRNEMEFKETESSPLFSMKDSRWFGEKLQTHERFHRTVLSPIEEKPQQQSSVTIPDTPSRNTRMQSLSQSLSNSTVTRSRLASSKVASDLFFQTKLKKRTQMNEIAKNRQQVQAEEMKKRYIKKAIEVFVGSYVSLRVDKRDVRVNSNRGILGVVLEVTIKKGIKVITEHGILAHKGNVAVIPSDTYNVLDTNATVSPKLKALRDQVLSGDMIDLGLVSKQEVHLFEHGPKQCLCKTKCGPSCRCVKKKQCCGSGCGCRVNNFVCQNCHNEE